MLQKIENYNSALAQLEQAVAIYQKSQQDALYRDGLIQRFEFTVELSWKSLKEYLEDQGFVLAASSTRAERCLCRRGDSGRRALEPAFDGAEHHFPRLR